MSIYSIFHAKYKEEETHLGEKSFSISEVVLKPALSIIAGSEKFPLIRKSSVENTHFIEENSLLEEPYNNPILDPNDGNILSLIGHIAGDSLIGGSPLEILPTHVGIKTFLTYLETAQNGAIPKELLAVLHQFLDISLKIAALPQQIAQARKELKQKKEGPTAQLQIKKLNIERKSQKFKR